jgi:hypothetical protein
VPRRVADEYRTSTLVKCARRATGTKDFSKTIGLEPKELFSDGNIFGHVSRKDRSLEHLTATAGKSNSVDFCAAVQCLPRQFGLGCVAFHEGMARPLPRDRYGAIGDRLRHPRDVGTSRAPSLWTPATPSRAFSVHST